MLKMLDAEIENKDSEIIIISAKIESEINELDSLEEKNILRRFRA